MQKLHRSERNGLILGVCVGITEYLGANVAVLRLGLILFAFMTGIIPALFFYLVAAIIMPSRRV